MAWPRRGDCGPWDLAVISLLSLRSFVDCQLPQALAGAIKAEEGISRRLIPTPTTKIAHDLSSRALLLCLYRPIESADAAWLSGRPRRALCAHRWRPDRLRRKSRLCELWRFAVNCGVCGELRRFAVNCGVFGGFKICSPVVFVKFYK